MKPRRREPVGPIDRLSCAVLRSHFSSATPTRRGMVRTMVGATLSVALGSLLNLGPTEAAKNRRRKQNDSKDKKKNKDKDKHNDQKGKNLTEVDSPRPPPSPPPPAPPTGPGFCPSDPSHLVGIAQVRRVAQTFLPPRGGRLTDAWVTLTDNHAGLDLTVDIRTVGPQGAPSNSVLASVQIVGIPQTESGSFRRTVAAAFNPPAAITVGQHFALTVTGPDGQEFSLEGNGAGQDACSDGRLFRDDEANAVFYPTGSSDLVFAISVTD